MMKSKFIELPEPADLRIDYPQATLNYAILDTEELIDELKRRGIGVFNLSLPFIYKPKDEN